MSDRIQLLPDHIANQIAAGEVIQRPASAVKELLENAVDAGATSIKLIVNDAGKALVQVVDNGSGIEETDARLAFERHATSKIRRIEDLFSIRTMGFRGEALASIAAVAQVELRTRRPQDELGTCLVIENSIVQKQEPVAAPPGTSIAMKNLFFNVPARRNFLKSNNAELRHIVDEFMRVALAFPAIQFSLTSNGQGLFHLEGGSLKARIGGLLGASYPARIVPVGEETDYLNIRGFVGKPDTAKKTRGDQFFFVNNRFIRSPYLNHAVQAAYQDLLPNDSYPMYVLFIDLDPQQVDVNVHPTKQEIKFEDEKIVYAFVQAAVKHALAQFSITPTLDFSLNATIQGLEAVQQPFTEQHQSQAVRSPLFRTFTEANQAHRIEASGTLPKWTDQPTENAPAAPFQSLMMAALEAAPSTEEGEPVQLFGTFILLPAGQRLHIIHQGAAHERVRYERLQAAMAGAPVPVQRSLFPTTLELTPADAVLLLGLLPHLSALGYQVETFGANSFVIQGTPADLPPGSESNVVESILEQYKHFSAEWRSQPREALLRSVAAQGAIRPGTRLTRTEMQTLINDLFACAQPNVSPAGKPVMVEFSKDYLDKMFS